MTNKEINKMIEGILGIEPEYEVRHELRYTAGMFDLQEAKDYVASKPEDEQYLYTISSSPAEKYSENLNLALNAVKRICDKSNHTFVLTYGDGEYKAAFGDYRDCAEYSGSNPAYCTCVALLKFMGRL